LKRDFSARSTQVSYIFRVASTRDSRRDFAAISGPLASVSDLDRVAGQVLTPSKLVLEVKGLPSIAEASALVVAGRNGRLLGTRVATERATCAIATGEGR